MRPPQTFGDRLSKVSIAVLMVTILLDTGSIWENRPTVASWGRPPVDRRCNRAYESFDLRLKTRQIKRPIRKVGIAGEAVHCRDGFGRDGTLLLFERRTEGQSWNRPAFGTVLRAQVSGPYCVNRAIFQFGPS